MLLRGRLELLKNCGKSLLIQLGLLVFACLFVVLFGGFCLLVSLLA